MHQLKQISRTRVLPYCLVKSGSEVGVEGDGPLCCIHQMQHADADENAETALGL